jgi:uncharacterized protein with GYD domain
MPTYVTLMQYTQKGIENIKQSPARVEAARQAIQQAGGALKTVYLTIGHYDLVCITEAPNDETLARILLSLGAQGNVRTETLKAFTEEEFRKIVAGLP